MKIPDAVFAVLLSALVLACRADGADFHGLPVVGQDNGWTLVDPRPGLAQRAYQNGKAKATYAGYRTSAKLSPLKARAGYPRFAPSKYWPDSLTFYGPFATAMASAMYLEGGTWKIVKSGATREGTHEHVFAAGSNWSCGGATRTNWATPWPKSYPTVLFFYTDAAVSHAVVLAAGTPVPVPDPDPPIPDPVPVETIVTGTWTVEGAIVDAYKRGGRIAEVRSYEIKTGEVP